MIAHYMTANAICRATSGEATTIGGKVASHELATASKKMQKPLDILKKSVIYVFTIKNLGCHQTKRIKNSMEDILKQVAQVSHRREFVMRFVKTQFLLNLKRVKRRKKNGLLPPV